MSWSILRLGLIAIVTLLIASGCVAKRTVTRDGVVVEQGYVAKNPFKRNSNLQ